MVVTDFIEKLNQWGHERVPFLFMVDFELEKPFACRLEEASSQGVLFDIRGFTNAPVVRESYRGKMIKHPIPFSEYQKKFNTVTGYLNYGDTFLANLTIKTHVEINGGLRDLFDAARAHYKILFKDQFLVFSPETFVRIRDGKIYAFPMKGTLDASIPNARKIILEDKKELAEHVTIVDLIRNDLSQVASRVSVRRFRYAEEVKTSEKNLWQISSEIVGDLPPGYPSRWGELLVRLLPAGSVSGAPKSKTLEIIRKAEQEKRGYYTGVVGYFNGTELDSGVMIRFVEKMNDQFFYRSGGGITTQSVAQMEYQEAIDKIYVPID